MKVVVLGINGFHLGYLGCYGNDWTDTPTLDRLAAEAVVFDRHHAAGADAAGARQAWRTGRYCFPAPDATEPVAEQPADLLNVLRQRSVFTHLITEAGPSSFAAGWDRTDVIATAHDDTTFMDGLRRLARQPHGLLWVESAALLPPWQVPDDVLDRYFDAPRGDEEEKEGESGAELLEPWSGPLPTAVDAADEATFLRLQSTYGAAVTHLDAWLGQVLDELRSLRLDEETWLFVTADHGFPLGEHGAVGDHRAWLHEERVHVPLLVRLPAAAEAGRRVLALTQHVDLMPTLLDLFDIPLPPVHGHSLLPLLRGQVESLRPYACSGLQIGEAVEWSLRTPDWSFMLPVRPAPDDAARAPQLYVKPDDRWEVNNVVQHHAEFAEYLEQTLHNFVAATRRPGPLQAPPLKDIQDLTTNPPPEGSPSCAS